ncbi:MAG: hypothetical protein IKH84_02850, partial [Ottowia sp.]|nr:hypothetical protein [Ottowia sp.]
ALQSSWLMQEETKRVTVAARGRRGRRKARLFELLQVHGYKCITGILCRQSSVFIAGILFFGGVLNDVAWVWLYCRYKLPATTHVFKEYDRCRANATEMDARICGTIAAGKYPAAPRAADTILQKASPAFARDGTI